MHWWGKGDTFDVVSTRLLWIPEGGVSDIPLTIEVRAIVQ